MEGYNHGTAKSSIFIGFSTTSHPAIGVPPMTYMSFAISSGDHRTL